MTDIKKEELNKNKARLVSINTELENLESKIIELNTEKKELIKLVRNSVKADLKELCEEYGLVIRNKTKAKKKADIDTED